MWKQSLSLAALGSVCAAALGARTAIRRSRAIDLSGARVLITGGSRGLGLATARAFLREGAHVAICARSAPELRRAKAALEREHEGATVVAERCDVTDARAVTAMVADVVAQLGRIDVLVSCAAEMTVGPLSSLTPTDFQASFHRIFFSTLHPIRAVLPQMAARGAGRIVNVTSLGGRMPIAHLGAYSVAKFAATAYSETLAIEARKLGVRVSTVTPPPLRNAAFLNARMKGDAEGELRWFAGSLTSGLFSIDPERAARAIVAAARFGDAERSVSPISWLAARLYALMPSLAIDAMAAAERVLPQSSTPSLRGERASDVARTTRDPVLRAALESAAPAAERYMQPGRI